MLENISNWKSLIWKKNQNQNHDKDQTLAKVALNLQYKAAENQDTMEASIHWDNA